MDKYEIMNKIEILKLKLHITDYKAIKYLEGEISYAEYLPVKQQRQAWRTEIDNLEEQLKTM